MGQETAGREQAGRIVLAREPPFDLGSLRVEPGARQVIHAGRSMTLEPRVMQVLVVLAEAGGGIVSRDELIERCWDGRIVTDDAVNRVLSRLRGIGGDMRGSSFTIETIARVGYRLVVGDRDQRAKAEPVVVRFPGASMGETPQEKTARLSRRGLLAAGLGTTAGAAGLALWKPWQQRGNPEARTMFERGQLLMREGLPGQIRQASSYFKQATELDPNMAEAWGALALTYSHQLQGFDPEQMESLPGLIRSAAARAEALDPGNGDAVLAMIFATPIYRRWAEKEQSLKAVIARHPRLWLAHGRTGWLLQQVGRFEDAIAANRRALSIEPFLPISHALIINGLSALGRVQEGDRQMATAVDQWPANPALWISSYNHLLFHRRFEKAAAVTLDPDRRPSAFPPEAFETWRELADAAAGTDEKAREMVLSKLSGAAREDNSIVPFAARAAALLERPDLAFQMLDHYLLGRGSFGRPAPIGPTSQRWTDILFQPPLRALKDDPRYHRLLRDSGLIGYWERTGTSPDV